MKHATMTNFADPAFKSKNPLKPCCNEISACLFISKLQVLKKDLEDIQGRYHNPGLAMGTLKAIRELRDAIICANKISNHICTTAGNRKKDVALQDDFETAMDGIITDEALEWGCGARC